MAINPRTRRQRLGLPRSWPGARATSLLVARKRGNRRLIAESSTPPSALRVSGSRPTPVPGSPPAATPSATLDAVVEQFTASWERGQPVRAEDYVGSLPPTDAAELIYHEFCLAEAADLAPDTADYLRRFPDHSDLLSRLFSLHGVFSVGTLQRLVGPAELPVAGDNIGPYRLLRELGRGAFARVFLAEQSDLGDRLVVVKVANRPSGEPALLGRARHAHIVEVLRHIDADDGALHLVCMPFLGGATLGALLDARRAARRGRLRRPRSGRDLLALLDRASAPEYPPSDGPRPAREIVSRLSYPRAVAWMIARLAEALDHAERRGVTHGDIKPANILLTADGTPMLFDFNLAVDWHEADELKVGTDLGGTLAYMAPERLRVIADSTSSPALARPASRRQPDRHRADLYALGLVLAEALTGQPPLTPDRRSVAPRSFASELARLRGESAQQPALRARLVPPALRAILARCLAPDPSDRYARGGELAADLDRWRSDRRLVHAAEPTWSAWARRARSLRFLILAVALTAVVAAVVSVAASQVMQGTLRDQALAKWAYVLDNSDGVFKMRRFGQWQSTTTGDPADVATRHLAQYEAGTNPRWRDRADVRSLPDRERGEVEAWVLEQMLRKAAALADRPESPRDWDRALGLLNHAIAQSPVAAFRNLRASLQARPGWTPSALGTTLEPTAVVPPAWLEAYLAGVAAEPLHAREALGYYLDALKGRPDLFWGHYRAAVVACRIDEYPIAIEHLRECVVRRPSNETLRTLLSALQFKLEQDAVPGSSLAGLGDAQTECDRALALNPDFAEAHFTRTWIRQAAGQVESAQADMRRFSILTRSSDPTQSLTLGFTAQLGYGFSFRPRSEAEEATLRQAVQQDPTNENHRMLLALGLDAADRKSEAIEHYDQILRANKDHLRARYRRAVLNHDRDHDATIAEFVALIAHPRFEETFREYPSMIHAYHHVATDLMKRGKLEEAEAVAQRSLTAVRQSRSLRESTIRTRSKGTDELAPEAETAYLLARIHATAAKTDPKRWPAAVAYLRDAFALQPSFRRTWFAGDLLFEAKRAEILAQVNKVLAD